MLINAMKALTEKVLLMMSTGNFGGLDIKSLF